MIPATVAEWIKQKPRRAATWAIGVFGAAIIGLLIRDINAFAGHSYKIVSEWACYVTRDKSYTSDKIPVLYVNRIHGDEGNTIQKMLLTSFYIQGKLNAYDTCFTEIVDPAGGLEEYWEAKERDVLSQLDEDGGDMYVIAERWPNDALRVWIINSISGCDEKRGHHLNIKTDLSNVALSPVATAALQSYALKSVAKACAESGANWAKIAKLTDWALANFASIGGTDDDAINIGVLSYTRYAYSGESEWFERANVALNINKTNAEYQLLGLLYALNYNNESNSTRSSSTSLMYLEKSDIFYNVESTIFDKNNLKWALGEMVKAGLIDWSDPHFRVVLR